ncbi:hypothetical protein [Oxobacter pfennigii]|nr:hypothetical protein [Oxobacter pfennigii]
MPGLKDRTGSENSVEEILDEKLNKSKKKLKPLEKNIINILLWATGFVAAFYIIFELLTE